MTTIGTTKEKAYRNGPGNNPQHYPTTHMQFV